MRSCSVWQMSRRKNDRSQVTSNSCSNSSPLLRTLANAHACNDLCRIELQDARREWKRRAGIDEGPCPRSQGLNVTFGIFGG